MSETESFATVSPDDDFVYLAAFQQLVLERTHDLITVLNPSGTIVYASPSWQAMTGWDPDGLVGTPILELVDDAIDTMLQATGADRAAVLLHDNADVMRFRAWRGLSDEYRAQAEGHSPWAVDAIDPWPVLISDVGAAGFAAELERAVRSE